MDSVYAQGMTSARIAHGGNLEAAEKRFGRPETGWLDLSTGINRRPYPLPSIEAAVWRRLPGSDAGLRAAAAECYGVADPRLIVPAPGAQSLIQLLPGLRQNAKVAVLSPTYEEHAASWRNAGHHVAEIETLDDAASLDVVVLVNPNNPDGKIVDPARLIALSEVLAAKGGFLVVDESFADADPTKSVAKEAGRPGLIVLRSFGKFFGLAGLRLGFALCEAGTAATLKRRLGSWALNGPALVIGESALLDDAWIGAMRQTLKADAQRMDRLLTGLGMRIVGGTSLFRLAETDGADELYERLGRRGILLRAFPKHPKWLRFGLPGPESEWKRLEAALS
ncbi:Threonine-phosphate decarboxylase [Rhodospirillaceae bacterium LM-1]|nr:Threonine-phosphate decarboxylase [Rhodospirillaceae bacterium LM-1]